MRKTPIAKKRKKRSEKEILRDKAWATLSRYVRNRDLRCVTCPIGKAENAGHFWHGILDFDEININAQCVQCNKWKSGNLNEYAVYLIRRYGIRSFLDLYDRKNLAKGGEYRTEEDYKLIIQKYGGSNE